MREKGYHHGDPENLTGNYDRNRDRDLFAEGADAAIAGDGDTPPKDVSELGSEAESLWLDGYHSIAADEAD